MIKLDFPKTNILDVFIYEIFIFFNRFISSNRLFFYNKNEYIFHGYFFSIFYNYISTIFKFDYNNIHADKFY